MMSLMNTTDVDHLGSSHLIPPGEGSSKIEIQIRFLEKQLTTKLFFKKDFGLKLPFFLS